MSILKLFNKPKIIGICANVNAGKSNLLYHIINTLSKESKFSLYSYGLRSRINAKEQKIYSVEELEQIKNSIIIIDEFFSLFDIDNRKKRKMIEKTLRLINHNNNILILAGLPENYKKFISAKLDMIFFKKCTLSDFINGSRLKNIVTSYKGNELGSAVLNLNIDKALLFDGRHFNVIHVPYYKKYDSKKNNEDILKRTKKRSKKRVKRVQTIVQNKTR